MNVLAPLRHIFRRRAVGRRVPEELRRRYRALYEARVEPTPDGGAVFDRARLWRRGGVNVLRLVGDRFEMAFQHGRLLEAEIARGTLEQTSLLVGDAIRNSFGNGLLSTIFNWYADKCIAEPITRSSLAYLGEAAEGNLAEIYGLADGCRVPLRAVLRGGLGPETAQVLLGVTEAAFAGSGAQCSSFAVWGSAAKNGEMLIGRNTDYPLNGYFDGSPAAIYFEPTDGGCRYLTITSSGMHMPGVCGMNEHGLYLCVHTVPTCSVSETGIQVFLAGHEILRRARNLDEAAAMLKTVRPAAGWNYNVVSARERRAFTWELCHAAAAMRPCEENLHITTNHWTQPATLPHLLTAIGTFTGDSQARAQRIRTLIEAAQGGLDAVGAASILGDTINPSSGKPRVFPNTIAATHTVSSSVWRPDAHTVYVGAGPAPTSHGRFVALPTPDALNPEALTLAPVEFLEGSPVCATTRGLAQARQMVIAARIAFEYHNDARAAADLLACAAAHYDDPALELSQALMEIRGRRFQAAWGAAERAIEQDWDPRSAVIARYLRGRLAADRGAVETARVDLEAVQHDQHADPRLVAAARAAAHKLRGRPRLRLRSLEIVPMGWLPDAFRYFGVM